MLILFESAVGYSLFKVLDEEKIKTANVDNIWKEFATQSKRSNFVQLHAFEAFKDMEEAEDAAKCLGEGEKLHKSLSKFVKKHVIKKKLSDSIGVIDARIGGLLHSKYDQLSIVSDSSILECHRGLREHFIELLSEIAELDSSKADAMNLGLSHVLSRHKIQFSAEKVDTMIIQAIALLDELDKEINIYAMRVKEWYGWHFPEMTKIVVDNKQYCRVINAMGFRKNWQHTDLSSILQEDVEIELKNMAKISMGSDITQSDLDNIQCLATQVLELSEYRDELFDYLRKRMTAIAPNLTYMVGELVGARLLSHAGSLINLAKYPASTVQILGAEKALFRALKTKADTPKYGLIYHAAFVNAASQMNKAKIARTLACKTSLAARVDAFCAASIATKEETDVSESTAEKDVASGLWTKMEQRINYVEGRKVEVMSKSLAGGVRSKHEFGTESALTPKTYTEEQDFVLGQKRKEKEEADDEEEQGPPKKKQKVDETQQQQAPQAEQQTEQEETPKKKKKKDKKKKKKKKTEEST
eukprot:CAMPEP_0197020782 /NCGR_PEP_ID=MMETSP1384-20130603/1675_1 /TAXON_ID=29189 /ORGANISM="Ammonia sp." /LENGTH=528 /DNA_ID=CAMNT_0042448471 /DNA_START=39 /DNA_END=1625 /DNA_ORIENTATION=+